MNKFPNSLIAFDQRKLSDIIENMKSFSLVSMVTVKTEEYSFPVVVIDRLYEYIQVLVEKVYHIARYVAMPTT